MSSKSNPQGAVERKGVLPYLRSVQWVAIASWVVTFLLVTVLLLVLLKINPFAPKNMISDPSTTDPLNDVEMPNLAAVLPVNSLIRAANLDTTLPEGTRQFATRYTVLEGDSIFGISKEFGVTPESILWANFDLLNDDPTFLAPGWSLTIPPTNGVYYKWKEDDTLQKVAEKFRVNVEDIASWAGNGMEVTNPQVTDQEYLMIPGGYRDLVQWIIPMEFAPRSGVTRVIAGPGGCSTQATGPIGSYNYMFPVGNHSLSGFDYSNYHRGIDLAAGEGSAVVASDSGTVIYSGWNDSGYGWLVVIDHNNGDETLYAHLLEGSLAFACGQSVYQGQFIALSGNSGKSTGGHLHFEIRRNGGFLNPWQVGLY